MDLKTRHEAVSINRETQTVTVRNLQDGMYLEQGYGILVLATGARAVMPDLPGIDLPGVFPMKEFQDGIDLKSFLENQKPGKAVIIGGGYIGVEVAESFRGTGMDVTVVEALPRIMAIMDDDMSLLVGAELKKNGVEVITGRKVIGLDGDTQVRAVKLDDGTSVEADCVLVSIGVAPNNEMAVTAGLELGPRGAIQVDRYQRTSDPHIFAAGDCCTVYHRLLCRDVFIPLGLTANRQGRMCGENIVLEMRGEKLKPFPGVIGTAVTRVFGLEIAKTGIGQVEVDRHGLRHISDVKIKARTLPGYFPGSSDLWVKLFFEDDSRVIVGGQIIGGPGSALRINTVVAAATKGMRLDELYTLDTAYAPPISPVWDPLLIAARSAMKR
ncbi:MAG TPA: FAD-dependent oxidoreductase [Deltaproteobacteria bacterium]|nr:FAD-dependent oxidoreductase [Deltaproteobacteria bacterium]HOY75822.1 FAD-dependent oxidoreductase [Deltaproteobacteria bacterium]HPA76585.1 FAD-dependent oxidoreductase [Deltaproteobacteria bacterium]HPE45617.1 FAD-dependent oxidoreductase [Deltaproteobacteria bacterium]HPH51210.1 FAD-dependent oxidoreductase [Deltaproteobacteria bacterium]